MQAVLPLFSAEEGMRLLSGSREGLEWLAFSSLGNPNGRLWGIRAEKLILFSGEKKHLPSGYFVGIAEEAFTGSCEGIVPPSLWKEDSGMKEWRYLVFLVKIPFEPLDTGKRSREGYSISGGEMYFRRRSDRRRSWCSGAAGRRGGCDGKICSD